MPNYFDLAKKYYVMGIFDSDDLDDFVVAGKITAVEKEKILASKPE